MQNNKIKFSPLHDGVGFHPFSEGLPYAPQTKTIPTAPAMPDYSRGAGAMSAGAPTFPMPKTARQMQQVQKPAVAVQTFTTPTPVKTLAPSDSILRRRFFAYLLDTVVHLGFWIAVNLIATFGFHFNLDGALLSKYWMGFALFFTFSQWFFIAMQEVLFETSIGKSFFGLEFKRTRQSFFASSLFLRSVVFMFGMLCMGLGLLYRPQDSIAELQLKHS